MGGAAASGGAGVPARVVAVDWSGAAAATAARKIWLCEVAGGAVTRLEPAGPQARATETLCAMVRESRAAGAPLAIGLDFAFSLPAGTLGAWGVADARALWARATAEGDAWLGGPTPPFWGRGGVRRPTDLPAEYRATEREVQQATGARPSSVFKLVGPDQVGAASVRGMPTLAALADAGAAVWPFDDPRPGRPLVVEIWPRVAYAEPVVKSRPEARAAYLARRAPGLSDDLRARAERSDDAFDALAAALAMWDDRATLAALPPARTPEERLEGRIWWPGLPLDAAPAAR